MNRVHPRFGTEHSSGLRARAVSLGELRIGSKETEAARDRLVARYDNLADFNEIAERERSHLETVRVRVGSAAVAFVPYLAHDVYDFDALGDRRPDPVRRSRRGGAAGAARPGIRRLAFRAVETILVAAEASWIRDQVQTAFVQPGQRVVEVQRGQDVRKAVSEYEPSVVILDMQIGNMGGIAVALDIRLEQGEGRMPETQILLLLDREADKFLATRSDVDGVLVKPVDAGRLRRAVKNLRNTDMLTVAESAAASLAGLDPAVVPSEAPDAPEPVDLAPET